MVEQGSSSEQQLSVSVTGEVITRRRAIISHVIFTAINFLNYSDRFTIAGVLSDIQTYFDLNEAQKGFIQTVFIIVYMVFAPLFGYLGDRFNRKYILMCGVLLWSFFTLCGSFVGPDSFWLFLLIRGCVGIGESSYVTVAPAMIGDLFSQSERMMAISLYSFAVPFGSGFGYILGTAVTSIAKDSGANQKSAWQWSLRVTPILGVILVILTFLFVPEPARGAKEAGNQGGKSLTVRSTFREDVKYLLCNKTVVYVSLGFTAVAYVAGCLSFWAPNFLEDAYLSQGTTPDANLISLGFGAVTCVAGFAGVALGAYSAGILRSRYSNCEPLVSAVGVLVSAPMVYITLVVVEGSPMAIWPFVLIGEITLFLNWALVPKILIDCVVPQRRALASGLSNMLSHLLGDAYSPTFVGFVADKSFPNPTYFDKFKGLQTGLLTCPIVCVLGAAAFFACAFTYDADKKRTDIFTEQQALRRNKSRTPIDGTSDLHSHHDHQENTPNLIRQDSNPIA